MAFLGMSEKLDAKDKNPSISISAWRKKNTIRSKKEQQTRKNILVTPIMDRGPHLQIKKKNTNNTIVKLGKYMKETDISQKMKYRS